MKHLVLGSEGQIGKYVCDEIEYNGDEVIRWDIKLDKQHDLRLFSNINLKEVLDVFNSADFIHFLAFDVGGSTYLEKHQNEYPYINNNIRIMENTFRLLKTSGKPFYFASSQMSNMPDSVYGQLKAVGESYTRALGGGVVRFWNVYGYESDPEKTHVITDLIKQGLNEYRVYCKTDGQEQRHFTHAKDAAWMLYNVYKYYDVLDKTRYWDVARSTNFDFDDDDGYGWASIETVANRIGHMLKAPVYFSKNIDKVQTVKNEIDRYFLSATREETHRWITLKEGVKDMIERIAEDES